jgi:hypothetical protein
MKWSWGSGYSGGASSGASSGSSGGTDWGFWAAAASAVMSGVSASSQASRDRSQAREMGEIEGRNRIRSARVEGDETRRTIDFENRLTEANRLNERARLARAWTAWGKGDNSKPAAQPVLGPDFNTYAVPPEYDFPTTEPAKPAKPNKG